MNIPNPDLILQTLTSYQRTAALKAAIDLDVFSMLADGPHSAAEIAKLCAASERGTRMLCDYLTVIGLLSKTEGHYGLTRDSATFLSKRSPSYLGGVAKFLVSPTLVHNFDNLAETVRRGTVTAESNTVAAANPVWVDFARAMAPMMMPSATAIATLLASTPQKPVKVLDIAAGHGMFGITIAERFPEAEIVAVDWPAVLEVAMENAAKAGVSNRYRTLAGDAFTLDFGGGFDVALVTNFLHHFDVTTCTSFLKKVATALRAGGRVVVLEFVPSDNRVSPPFPASFVVNMLAGTPQGDVYTLADLTQMLTAAGFAGVQTHQPPAPNTIVVATKS